MRLGSKTVLGLVALAAALAIVVFVRGWGPAPDAEAAFREPLPPEARTGIRDEALPAETVERDASSASLPAVADREEVRVAGIRLVVVSARTGQPLAGARVAWFDFASVKETDSEPADEEALGRRGQNALTDAAGELMLPPMYAFLIQARHGSLWHEDLVTAPPDLLRLELEQNLVVEVQSGDGARVAGVPILLQIYEGERLCVSGRELTCEPGGQVEFSHDGLRAFDDARRKITVSVDAPLREPVSRTFDVDAIAEEPVRLTLPASGRVVVEARDATGEPFGGQAFVRLASADEPEDREVAESSLAWTPLEEGRAAFDFVGLDLSLVAHLRIHYIDQDFAFGELPPGTGFIMTHEFAGPRGLREEVLVSVVVGGDHPVLSGRLVDASGLPFQGRHFRASLQGDLNGVTDFEQFNLEADVDFLFSTDAAGRFRLDLPKGPRSDGRRTMNVRLDAPPGGAQLATMVDLPRVLPAGMVELGDIVVALPQLTASGIVVDAAGEPVPGAEVGLVIREPGQEYWSVDFENPKVQTDATGLFELRGLYGDDECALSVHKSGFRQSEFVPLEPGGTGLRIVLDALGAVEGTVHFDPDAPPQSVTFVLYGAGIAALRTRLPQPGREEQELLFSSLPPGEYTLDAYLKIDPESVFSETFLVHSGETTRVPDFDLRGRLRTLTLTVQDAEGNPVQSGFVYVRDVDGAAPDRRQYRGVTGIRSGEAKLVVTREAIDAEVRATGHRASFVTGLTDDGRVVLGQPLRVRLMLAEALVLPEPPRYLRATLEAHGARYPGGKWLEEGGFVDDSGQQSLWLPEPGAYQLQWWGVRGSNYRRLGTAPVTLQVQDTDQVQSFEVFVDQVMLDEALGE